MKVAKHFVVYIMASATATLYVGMTSDIKDRVQKHKAHEFDGFSAKYGTDRLVYWERMKDAKSAIAREKQIKRWRRERKVNLIETANPGWEDLSQGWYGGKRWESTYGGC